MGVDMNRRNFLKMMGAASVLTPIQAASRPLTNFSIKADALGANPPRIRMILVGESGLEYLDGLVRDISSPIRNWRPQDILYLDRYGDLAICPSRVNSPFPHGVGGGWKICAQAIHDPTETTSWFQRSEPAITEFISNSDWLFIVAALDNPMAFVASEKIATIARDAGVMSVAIVGTPYVGPISFSNGNALGSEALNKATMYVVDRMSEICQCTIPDLGGWSRDSNYEDGYEWSFYGSESALHMVADMATRMDWFAQISDALTTSGVCMVGSGYGSPENLRAAIEDAITYSGPCEWWGDTHITSTGAIFKISGGNEDMASRMKKALSLELLMPSIFLHYGQPFWRDDANFTIATSTSDSLYGGEECIIEVISTGVTSV